MNTRNSTVAASVELIDGELYDLGDTDPLYKPNTLIWERPFSECNEARMPEYDEMKSTGEIVPIVEAYDEDGNQIPRFFDTPAFDPFSAWVASPSWKTVQFRSRANIIVRIGAVRYVSRGCFTVEGTKKVAGVECYLFASQEAAMKASIEEEKREEAEWIASHKGEVESMRPVWAIGDPDVDADAHEVTIAWNREIIREKFFSADIYRSDSVEAGKDFTPDPNETIFAIGIQRNDMIDFISTEHMREAGRNLMDAAEKIDAILSGQ